MSVPPVLAAKPAATSSAAVSAKDAPADGSPQFADMLNASAQASAKPASGAPAASANPAADTAEGRLAAKIETLLASGVSYATIVKKFADALAAKGTPNADADVREKLAAQIAAALAPPGEPPPSRADGARALAARLRSLAEQLTGATTEDSGQQQRRLGTVSDAESAREHPAPATETAPLDGTLAALAALVSGLPAAPVSPRSSAPARTGSTLDASSTLRVTPALDDGGPAAAQSGTASATAAPLANGVAAPPPGSGASATDSNAALASFVSHLAASAEDGRRAASGDRTLLAPGATTLLGRVLTRAQNADALRSPAPAAPSTAAPAAVAGSGTAAIISSFESVLASIAPPPAALPPDLRIRPSGAAAADPSAASVSGPSMASAPASSIVTPSAAAAPAPPADPSHVIDQVLHAVSVRTLGTSSEIRLRLVPEHLGDVTVKLVVNGDAVNASVLTHSADARDALVGGAPALHRAFADAGLKLHTFSVDVSGGGAGGFPERQGGAPMHTPTARRVAFASDDDAETDALDAIPSFAPPDAVTAERGAHNYLV